MRNQIRFFYLKLTTVLLVSLISYCVLTLTYGPRASMCGAGDELLLLLPGLELPALTDLYWVPPNLEHYRFRCQDLPAGRVLSHAISLFPSALKVLFPDVDIFLFDRSSATVKAQFISLRMENIGRGVWLSGPPSASPVHDLSQGREDFTLPVTLTNKTMAEHVLTSDMQGRVTELRTNYAKTGFELSWLRQHNGALAFLARNYDGTQRFAACKLGSTLVCDNLMPPPALEKFPQEDLAVCDRVLANQPPGVPDSNTYLCLTSHIAELARTCDPQLSRFALRVSPYALPILTTLKVAQCLSNPTATPAAQNWINTAHRSTLKAGFFSNL
jgi:hypothetical protein